MSLKALTSKWYNLKLHFVLVVGCLFLPQLVILAVSVEGWSISLKGDTWPVLLVLVTVCPWSVVSLLCVNLSTDVCRKCWHWSHPVVSSPCSVVQHKCSTSTSARKNLIIVFRIKSLLHQFVIVQAMGHDINETSRIEFRQHLFS